MAILWRPKGGTVRAWLWVLAGGMIVTGLGAQGAGAARDGSAFAPAAWGPAGGGPAVRGSASGGLPPVPDFPADPDSAATGIRIGTLVFRPLLEVMETFDSNIFATASDPRGDWVTRLRPRVRLATEGGQRHAVDLTVGAEIGRHLWYPRENYEDMDVRARGRLDLTDGTALVAALSFARGHLPRVDPEASRRAVAPERVRRLGGSVGVVRTGTPVTVRADSPVTWSDHDDGRTASGEIVDADRRDSVLWRPGVRVAYTPVADNELALMARYLQAWTGPPGAGRARRDTRGADLWLSASRMSGALWHLAVAIGYTPRLFADPALTDVTAADALAGRLEVAWHPTTRTTVRAVADRGLRRTTLDGAAAVLSHRVTPSVTHTLRHGLSVHGRAGVSIEDYLHHPRRDRTVEGGIGAALAVSPRAALHADYNVMYRSSNRDGADLDRHRIGVGVTLRY